MDVTGPSSFNGTSLETQSEHDVASRKIPPFAISPFQCSFIM